jgi:hypothetical protein
MNQFEKDLATNLDDNLLHGESEVQAKCGWDIHYVPEGENNINAHTHGLAKKFGHLNLQLCIPLNVVATQTILNGIVVNHIAKGEVLTEESELDDVIENFTVRFMKTTESGRVVLRIIFPEKDGTFEGDLVEMQKAVPAH